MEPCGIEHTENDGWEAWSENGEINGKPDGTRRLEAIRIRLTGEAAEKYDIIVCTARIMAGLAGQKTERRPEVKAIQGEWKRWK